MTKVSNAQRAALKAFQGNHVVIMVDSIAAALIRKGLVQVVDMDPAPCPGTAVSLTIKGKSWRVREQGSGPGQPVAPPADTDDTDDTDDSDNDQD